MSTQDAANGFVSGELLLRSDENDDRCLPPALEKRLRDSLRNEQSSLPFLIKDFESIVGGPDLQVAGSRSPPRY